MTPAKYKVVPNDSRYIPFTQQKYDCVPTSILMIMYRNGIPLLPSEELGYHLGLVVPPSDKKLYYKPRVSKTPPPSGYGTKINKAKYMPNKVFDKLGIPLKCKLILADDIKNAEDLVAILTEVEKNDTDALLCFNYSMANELPYKNGGHVVVFDRIINGKIRIVDAWYKNPKWQLRDPKLLYKAIKIHGNKNAGGVWLFEKVSKE
jgi:hypothetical protein